MGVPGALTVLLLVARDDRHSLSGGVIFFASLMAALTFNLSCCLHRLNYLNRRNPFGRNRIWSKFEKTESDPREGRIPTIENPSRG